MFLDTERNAPPLNESISMTLLRYLYPEICSSNTDNTCAMTCKAQSIVLLVTRTFSAPPSRGNNIPCSSFRLRLRNRVAVCESRHGFGHAFDRRVESTGVEQFVGGCEVGMVLICDVLFEFCLLRPINDRHLIEFWLFGVLFGAFEEETYWRCLDS